MLQTAYINAIFDQGVGVARITREKVGDFEASPLLSDLSKLGEQCGWKLVLDLSEVQMLGSQGIGLFLKMRKMCEEKKGKIVLCSVVPEIMELLRISALLKLFTIKKDVAEAVAAVK